MENEESSDKRKKCKDEKANGKTVQSVVPKNRQNLLKWNGWGYKDSYFFVNNHGLLAFAGKRYPIGEKTLPHFSDWVTKTFNIDLTNPRKSQPLPTNFPESKITKNITHELTVLTQTTAISYSIDGTDRLIRAHGHTLHDIFSLRESFIERIPDVVVWPTSTEETRLVVNLAQKYKCAVIPFGGGTSVSGAVSCPTNESRVIISLDTSQMNKLMWLDEENLLALFQSGIFGQDLERELRERGFTSGHEPDSYEFSSLGGWVATRASGMKKNVYGNIEDLVVNATLVTPTGVLVRGNQAPRQSSGPDFNHVILGSEGTLGVVTEVTLKIRPLPKCSRYGSIVFPTFDQGVRFMREVARQRCQPSSIRLMDNGQFQFGQALKPASDELLHGLKEFAKRQYLWRWKGLNPTDICVVTLLFETMDIETLEEQERKIYSISARFQGINAGGKNGEAGYSLTFIIAYIRDIGLDFNVVSESFETSVPWDRTQSLCANVKYCVRLQCEERGITHYLISCRVTQTYDAGCCVYFYFAFNYANVTDPVGTYEAIETAARDEIIRSGGSISHHHGVGKLRKKWYPATVSQVGVDLYNVIKHKLDPENVFACGNLVDKPPHLTLLQSKL